MIFFKLLHLEKLNSVSAHFVKVKINDDDPLITVDGDTLLNDGTGLTAAAESEIVRSRPVTILLKATGYLVHVSIEFL